MDEYTEEKRTEQNLIVRSGKSEAEVTNNKRRYRTAEANYRQTRSIARPVCDSRATCQCSPDVITSPGNSLWGILFGILCLQNYRKTVTAVIMKIFNRNG